MAGLEMIQINSKIPVNKAASQRTSRQKEGVTGFEDMIREKDGLADGQDYEKGPASFESPSSEITEKKDTSNKDEENSLMENSMTEVQLNMLMTEVLMKLQPVMAGQPDWMDQEGNTEQGNPVPEVSGNAEQVHAAVPTENMGNPVPELAGTIQDGTIEAGTIQAGTMQAGAMKPGNAQPGTPLKDSREVTALQESVSRQQPETGAAKQNHQPVLEDTWKDLGEAQTLIHEETVLVRKGKGTSAEKIPYHMEGNMIHHQSMDKHSLYLQHQPVETLKSSPDTLPQDVAHMLGTRLPAGDGTLVIELEPAALGKLTIEVVYEEGKAAVSILASNPKTLELLSRNLSDIAYILEEKTGQETVIYTQQTDQQPTYNPQQEKGRQEKQDNREEKKEKPTDSFAQQLRLGLV